MTGTGHVSIVSNMSRHGHRVLLVALRVERDRGAHPGQICAGTERGSVAGEHDRAELCRSFAGQRREGRPQLRDERRIERVVDLGSGQRDPRHDVART